MFIYMIVNHATGKYYVGQHKGINLRKYLQQKFHHAQRGVSGNSRLFNSMRKHPDPLVWSIHALRSDINIRKELDELEKDFIAFLRAQDPEYGYNICRGGEGFTGPHTPEFGINHSRVMKEMWKQPEFIKRMAARKPGRLGIRWTTEERDKLSISHLGKKLTAGAVQKRTKTRKSKGIRSPMLGKTHSEETRRKMSEAQSQRRSKEPKIDKRPRRKYTMSSKRLEARRTLCRNSPGNHQRWHVSRGLIKPECRHCKSGE